MGGWGGGGGCHPAQFVICQNEAGKRVRDTAVEVGQMWLYKTHTRLMRV